METLTKMEKISKNDWLRASTKLIGDGFVWNLSDAEREYCLKIVEEYENGKS